MVVNRALYRRYKFFKKQAGYIVGQRAHCALSLARAEKWAKDLDMEFEWRYEEYPDEDMLGDHEYWCNDARRGVEHEHEILYCLAKLDGEYLASLGAIIDPSREYTRVVEAELADEARSRLVSPLKFTQSK